MRSRWMTAAGLASVLVASAACAGGPDYTYIESDDGHIFAKIPSDWNVQREGAIAFTMINPDQVQFAFTPGDDTQPWRAEFEAPGREGSSPRGLVESQHIDARLREEFRLNSFLDDVRATFDDYERTPFHRDGLVGYRVSFTEGEGSDLRQYHEVYYMDARRSSLYRVTVLCSAECVDRYQDDIDEVLTTFRVES